MWLAAFTSSIVGYIGLLVFPRLVVEPLAEVVGLDPLVQVEHLAALTLPNAPLVRELLRRPGLAMSPFPGSRILRRIAQFVVSEIGEVVRIILIEFELGARVRTPSFLAVAVAGDLDLAFAE
jgi:hypothetical protein